MEAESRAAAPETLTEKRELKNDDDDGDCALQFDLSIIPNITFALFMCYFIHS